MKAIVQRVTSASVTIDGDCVGSIGAGLLVLVAVHKDDTPVKAQKLADRIWGIRIFNDLEGKMNLSLSTLFSNAATSYVDSDLGILAISNFTIYGETSKNRRPSFIDSAPYELGRELFLTFVEEMKKLCPNVQTGEFGADMQVKLLNDGPVTVIIEV